MDGHSRLYFIMFLCLPECFIDPSNHGRKCKIVLVSVGLCSGLVVCACGLGADLYFLSTAYELLKILEIDQDLAFGGHGQKL